MKDLFVPKDSTFIKKEREFARVLKKSRWWKEKLQNQTCYHCGKKFSSKELTMDHLVPLVQGGRTGKNNVVPSCKKCNSKKSFKTLVELKLKK
ncbi:MAG: HNH endonuclease [Bdellovibrionales bacterium]|nr:HNH endonuclease [Bdellovibrionales bacterium]